MILGVLLLAAGTACADASTSTAARAPEETLRVMLADLRRERAWEVRKAVLGSAEELRDAVAAGEGASKERLADRLPGMAKDPFGICRDLVGCREAPASLHVEDPVLLDDAFMALARPWFKLQKARGKAVTVSVDPGAGVQLKLEDFPRRPVVTLSALPAPTGGFDVAVDEGDEAARDFAAERAAVLQGAKN
ncbi:MAG: hypothetical protein HYV14_11130 [Elusimicrobia bacterium]|nr:hypothetical protein [Elusimicrobiota bacterium]